jgi:hypothetical protein
LTCRARRGRKALRGRRERGHGEDERDAIGLQDFGSIGFTGIHDPAAQCSEKAEALAAQGVPTNGMVVNSPHKTCCITTGILRKVGIADCKPAADGPFKLEGVPDP